MMETLLEVMAVLLTAFQLNLIGLVTEEPQLLETSEIIVELAFKLTI